MVDAHRVHHRLMVTHARSTGKIQARVQTAMFHRWSFRRHPYLTGSPCCSGLAWLVSQQRYAWAIRGLRSAHHGEHSGTPVAVTGTTYYYNTTLGLNTLIGRFAMMVPMLALGGFLAEKKIAPESTGTFPVTGGLFVALLVGVILIVSALTFFPALSLGPIIEHLSMGAGRVF
jgi:hypothetical protein